MEGVIDDTNIYDKSFGISYEGGFVLPAGRFAFSDGFEQECKLTKFIVKYYREQIPANGMPAQDHKTIHIGYEVQLFDGRPIFIDKKYCGSELTIRDGVIIEPQNKITIHVNELDKRVIEALRKIKHKPTRKILRKSIQGF